jgi:MFS family permease
LPEPAGAVQAPVKRLLPAFVLGQVGVHAAMAGLRMAAPLQALREGYSAWAVGVLLALFALAPVALALQMGRLADRHGYHRPVAVAVLLTLAGALAAVVSDWMEGAAHFALLCVGAVLCGAGANTGQMAIQRSAGLAAGSSTERVQMFSWLGIAPSFSNVIGPLAAGAMIDLYGFQAAYLCLMALPLLTLWAKGRVPAGFGSRCAGSSSTAPAWELLSAPAFRRLLLVNWFLSTCWDVHTFAVPVLGHERGYSASTIGLVLAAFTASVTMVRLVVPLVARHLREVAMIRFSMLGTTVVFALYPLAHSPWLMLLCALALGLTLGVVQPMILNTLHHMTPDGRHGQALALRSMAMNSSSTVMPLLFGLAGSVVGAAVLFWTVGAMVGGGAWVTRSMRNPPRS